jgi:lysozyme
MKLLEELEGRRSEVYFDSKGLPTLGVGHLLTKSELSSGKIVILGEPVKYRNGLTHQQIDDLLTQDTYQASSCVDRVVTVSLTPCQREALISFVFNIGRSAFKQSTLLRKLNQGLYDEVPGQMRRWVYEGTKVSQGLINRREKEIKVWNNSISEDKDA